jgi:hypothetical protein
MTNCVILLTVKDMKRAWLFWLSVVGVLAALVIVLHATQVLPLPPAPPYQNGEKQWITPDNPWTW